MKALLALSALSLGFAISASAASQKICFGSGDDKGSRFEAQIGPQKVKITASAGEEDFNLNGSYDRIGELKGRDGKVYLTYDVPGPEGGQTMIVDRDLLKANTKGSLKIRWQGEGFEQHSYFCRDSN